MADKTLNKTELVAKIAASTGHSQATVDSVLGGLFDTVAEAISDGVKVTIPGWLAVERTFRAARVGRNIQTGAEIQIAAGHSVKVTAGTKLKAAVKK
ncbi:MAG: integration host factor [Candidatus Lumbricidophila eiseniae]|uniref:Integration host factor n=1 Tax=Candidatus Lumbricidiphila eiseniae TaxID=1969409 RepID=A0A2A6FR64_9MICO|nr:MAG: integration host factor [Candidatus Lumbricidophila eiseniae]